MHRASSGLHLPSTTIAIFQKCLRAPGTIIGHRSLLSVRLSSTTHLSMRQRSYQETLDTESSRGGLAHPVVSSSSAAGTKHWPSSHLEKYPVEEILSEEDSKLAGKTCGQDVPTGLKLSPQYGTDSEAKEIVEEDEEHGRVPPSNSSVQEKPFLSGRPWTRQSVRPLRATPENGYGRSKQPTIPSLDHVIADEESVYQDMLHVLATTPFARDGWKAYGILSRLQKRYDTSDVDNASRTIPLAHLHRLARLIAGNIPKTRSQFLQLLSVLTTIQNYGGEIQLHQWNALIDHAGKGWRKTRPEDFNNSLSIYYDMICNRPPGSRFSDAGFEEILNPRSEDDYFNPHPPPTPAVEPDIHTYTTLIDIASRTNHPPVLHRATTLLKQARLPPNRITHLSLLKFFTARKQLSGIRSTLARMREQNLEIGVDGLNACMWAYGHNNRVDLVMTIYRLLRHNMVPEEHDESGDIAAVKKQLCAEEGIVIAPDLRINEVTFTLMIQTMAYHGNLLAALSVFIDMLSTPNIEQGAPLVLDKDGELQSTPYSPTIHVFRAILLGFSRHGTRLEASIPQANFVYPGTDSPEWNLENLQCIFEKFLELPPDTRISESTIFWTLNAFSRTSGHDIEVLRAAWLRMENRFGTFKGGANHRLTKWRCKLFPELKENG